MILLKRTQTAEINKVTHVVLLWEAVMLRVIGLIKAFDRDTSLLLSKGLV